MPDKSVTRADISEAIYREVGLSRTDAARLLRQVLEEIAGVLVSGENVKLSSFGTFEVRQKKERIGRNPKTKEEVPITPRRVVTFRASQVMKKRINGGE
ncbi:MAG TPA: integration host factor subunit alpha [Thermopetrobacter sp.]|nr:integration host factor subunit alpha [Thermopetrobacter sp.]